MSDPFTTADEITVLAALYLDNELDAVGCDRLNALLTGSADAVRCFNDHCLHARTLSQSLSGRAAIAPRLTHVAASHPARVAAVDRLDRRSIAPVVWSIAAALVLTAAAVAIYLIAIDPQPELHDPQPDVPVATLIETTGGATVLFGDDVAFDGQDYPPGLVSIDAGSAYLQLTSGASVTLRGKTSIVVHSDKLATLEHGAVDFYCPPSAVGFTVQLPGGLRVVDLGTAFSIESDDDGEAVVRVSEGRVRVEPVGEGAPAELIADQAVAVTSRGSSLIPVAFVKPIAYAYVGALKPGPTSEHQAVTDRRDESLTELTDGVIGGGDFHEDDRWAGVINLTRDPSVPTPSILFDLGESRTVTSLKVTYLVDHEPAIHAPSRAAIAFGDTLESLGDPVEDAGFDDTPHGRQPRDGDVRTHTIRFTPRSARYIQLDLYNEFEWTFISEVEIEASADGTIANEKQTELQTRSPLYPGDQP